jgi:two-component system NtrC family sensor kinase
LSLKSLLSALFLLIALSVPAQKRQPAPIDTLLGQLPAAKEDTNKINLLIRIGQAYSSSPKNDTALFYYQRALLLARRLDQKKWIPRCLYRLGEWFFLKGDYIPAQNYLKQAIEEGLEAHDYPMVYKAVYKAGWALSAQDKTPEAISYVKAVAERLKQANNRRELANIYNMIGDLYEALYNYSAAIDYYNKAGTIEEADHAGYLDQPYAQEVGFIYMHIHNTNKAKWILLKAEAKYEKAHDDKDIATNNFILGECSLLANDPKGSIYYYKKALQAAKKINSNSILTSGQNSISWAYYLIKDYDNAYAYAVSAIKLDKAQADSSNLTYAMGTLGSIYREAPAALLRKAGIAPGQRYQKAAALMTIGIKYGKAHDDLSAVAEGSKELSATYEKMHRYEDALSAYKESVTVKDRTDSLTDEKTIALKEAGVNFSHKEDSLNYQQRITSAQLKQKKQQSYFFIGGIAVLLVLSLFIGLNYRNQRRSNKLLATVNGQLSEQREEIASQRDQLAATVTNLKAAQQQLIQSEKMASLGELTAGIAHEIQNPLNFVNNFSDVNREMLAELKEALQAGNIEEALTLTNDLEQNEDKINHHGKRADAIVKSMLEHSRASSGQKEPADLNKLADEYLRLAYHGLRAKDKSFNAELITHFDENLPAVNIVPQDIGRVLLNLFNNAFYAVQQKQKTTEVDYQPTVELSTSVRDQQVQITVKDNGAGIPDTIKDKIMQPFFTTKPTGQGTGLGLSLSYDIIVKGHGGSIGVKSANGEGATFAIILPGMT